MFSRRDFQRIWIYSLLIIPFVGASRGWEPYPAIILPAGASLISQNEDTIAYQSAELWAIGPDDHESEVDIGKFLGRIRRHFWKYIAKRELGFAVDHKSRGKSTHPEAENDLNGDPRQRAEMVAWMQERLVVCGIDEAVALKIKWVRKTVNIGTGETVDHQIVKESHVSLAQR